jgi:hypothetical protein
MVKIVKFEIQGGGEREQDQELISYIERKRTLFV